MTTVTHDATAAGAGASSRTVSGLGFALLSAVTFGTSGTLASGLLEGGWTAGSVVLVRIGVGAVLVLPFGLASLRGRWRLLRRRAGLVTAYGVLAVAGAQLFYFQAVTRMQVGPALMIEYTAPAAVVGFLWLRHGQRPGPVTLAGTALAGLGLVLVLDLASGGLDPVGVLWALGAMVGVSSFFVLSADEDNGVPPMALAAGGLLVGAVLLGLLGLVGVLPMSASTRAATYAGTHVAWWLPLLGLGLLSAAISYTSGIAASRRLGSRLSSFVGLLEVVCAVVFAWLLLDELPGTTQLVGGATILAGVVVVKLGEPRSPAAAAVLPAGTP